MNTPKFFSKAWSIVFVFMFLLAGMSPTRAAASSQPGAAQPRSTNQLSASDWAQIRKMIPSAAVVPTLQQAYVKASNTDASDFFSYTSSVALDGDTLAVGACQEDSNATGVNGDQSNNSAVDSGAVYVFTRSGSTWSQQAYLKASNTEAGDGFGCSVAISGDTLVVGAPYEDGGVAGINGDQTDNSATDSGAAYVFTRSGTTWSQQAYLKAFSYPASGDGFGYSVAISGDTIVVGAYLRDVFDTIVHANVGSAYVFTRSGTTWSAQATLLASNYEANDRFGIDVAVSGNTIVVGADYEDSNTTGVDGIQTNNSAFNSGAAYVFYFDGTSWNQQAYLKASNTDSSDGFGYQVAVSGDTVAVGAYGESSNATGINGDGSDNSVAAAGAAYVFTRSGVTWSQQAYVKASNPEIVDYFGVSLALDGDLLVVGAWNEDSNATGFNDNQADNSAQDSGAVYLFTRSGTTWSQQTYLKASNTELGDSFGNAVGVSGSTVAVGAWLESSNATGIDGNQADNSATNSGAVYVFGPPPPAMNIKGNSVSITNGSATPSATDDTDFGLTAVAGGTVDHIFTIENSGLGDLNLTGSPLVSVTGANAADFSVTAAPMTPVSPSGSTTFTVRFDPSDGGLRTATISIANNDGTKNPYTFAIQGTGDGPEINVKGNGVSIANGDATPSAADFTDFGTAVVNSGSVSRIFTIQNLGTTNLNLNGTPKVVIGGAAAAEFTVTVNPVSSVSAASSTTFTVKFMPVAIGARLATISIASDDANENPYVFTIKGIGTAPEINITGKTVNIPDGDATPSTADGTDFGALALKMATVNTFTIQNRGNANLNLTGAPKVIISGPGADDFSVTVLPTSPVAPAGSTNFSVKFSPTDGGLRKATISIANNDGNENPYTFAVQGTGIGEEINLKGKGVSIPSGDTDPALADNTDFGFLTATTPGGVVDHTFTIENLGTRTLNLTGTPIVKVVAPKGEVGNFVVLTQPASPTIAAGGLVTFIIRFKPAALDGLVHQATVIISNSDVSETPYTFTVQGFSGTGPLMVVKDSTGAILPLAPPTKLTLGDSIFDFSLVDVANGMQDETFTIENHGNAALTFTATPKIKITGDNASDFTVITQPTSPVPPGGSTTFTIRFNPSVLGARKTLALITNNDAQYKTSNSQDAIILVGAGAQERLKNGGMETGSPIPASWVASAFTGTDGKDTTVKKEGLASVKITGTNAQKTLTQTITLAGAQKDKFLLSFWVRGVSIIAGTCKIQVALYNGATMVHTFTSTCPTGTYAFQQQWLYPWATGAYDSVKVIFTYSGASGTVWFDDVSLLRP